jgi:predicted ester cyclase
MVAAPAFAEDTVMDQEIEDLKAKARRSWEEIFPACDDVGLAEVTAADVVEHGARPDEPAGIEGVRRTMHWLAGVFSEQRWEIHQVIGEGETVVVHATHHGIHTGEFMGIPPTGRRVAYDYAHIVRFRDGKVAEHWGFRDQMTLMAQLGLPGGPTPRQADMDGADSESQARTQAVDVA